jgi:hypothetical protein
MRRGARAKDLSLPSYALRRRFRRRIEDFITSEGSLFNDKNNRIFAVTPSFFED